MAKWPKINAALSKWNNRWQSHHQLQIILLSTMLLSVTFTSVQLQSKLIQACEVVLKSLRFSNMFLFWRAFKWVPTIKYRKFRYQTDWDWDSGMCNFRYWDWDWDPGMRKFDTDIETETMGSEKSISTLRLRPRDVQIRYRYWYWDHGLRKIDIDIETETQRCAISIPILRLRPPSLTISIRYR